MASRLQFVHPRTATEGTDIQGIQNDTGIDIGAKIWFERYGSRRRVSYPEYSSSYGHYIVISHATDTSL
jgi:hypothetical protein